MKISLNWIKKYTDIDVSTDELVKLATERLGGIEAVTDYGKHFEGIVAAKVVSCIKHPNADKLSLCMIDDGGVMQDVARDENGHIQVVCGAPNVREGLLVAWIPPGAIVPASYGEKELFVLEARDLRGQLSNGMLASPAELGMSDDHSGILEIEEDVKPGTPFKNLYDLDDTILEIENKMFTHRPDGFGHLGVAREIAGIQHTAFKSPDWYLNPKLPSGKTNVSIEVEDPELSPRYMAVEFEVVTVKPSPLWLQSYLKRVGIRPINNIVDITNYIMMLTAQPVHAFDFDKIAAAGKAEISVRRPKEGEKMTLLDGKEITPHKDATLICNTNGPIALGGVMGGGNSEIDENTTHVVLECATFNMYNVRKTSMIHGLFTDAATRLTKGQPAEQLPSVLAKAIEMFEEFADAKTIGVVDEYPTKNQGLKTEDYIEIDTKFINDRLGSKFSTDEIVSLLTNVEIGAHEASGPISVTPPFWRTDLEIKEDIVEEVGRLYGFNQLPVALPQRSIAPVTPDPKRSLKTELRHILSRAGTNEVLTYSFVHGNLLKKVGQNPENSYVLRNALSPDLQYYRQSLLPSLLDLVRGNIKAGFNEFALFEVGKVHIKDKLDEEGLPKEFERLALVYAKRSTAQEGSAYYQAKRFLEYCLAAKGVKNIVYTSLTAEEGDVAAAPFEPGRSATVRVGDMVLGRIGEFKPSVVRALKLPEHSAGFEIGIEPLLALSLNSEEIDYQPLSKFPSTEQDLTLKIEDGVAFSELEGLLKAELTKTEYDWKIEPLSIFKKQNEKTKNVSFRIMLTHQDRTLTTHEVTELIEKLSWQAHDQLGAEQV